MYTFILSYKRQHLIGDDLHFQILVLYQHGQKHGGTQSDIMLLEKMRVQHLIVHTSE